MTTDNAFERIDSAPIVTLQTIDIPDSINRLPYAEGAEHLIYTANDAIEAFVLADQTVIENFVTCDFHLLDQAIIWTGERKGDGGRFYCGPRLITEWAITLNAPLHSIKTDRRPLESCPMETRITGLSFQRLPKAR